MISFTLSLWEIPFPLPLNDLHLPSPHLNRASSSCSPLLALTEGYEDGGSCRETTESQVSGTRWLHLPKEEKSRVARKGLGLEEGAPAAIAGVGAKAQSVCEVERAGDKELSGVFWNLLKIPWIPGMRGLS